MIISRTPLRVSFVGGGSDLPSFYRQHGGAVVSISIKKYIYLSMHKYFEDDGFILKYSDIENVDSCEAIRHRIIRQVFSDYDIKGVDFNSSADVPAGTGMGSSSAFTVGLINLCHAYKGLYIPNWRLAELACEVELDKLGEPIGKQDQYGCALGGMNLIEFSPDGSVNHAAVPISAADRRRLERGLLLFYLGGTRSASALLETQSRNSASDLQVIENLKQMALQARALRHDICRDVDVIGGYLHDGWERKRRLAPDVSNPLIDNAYERARAAGATGGKLLGAGGAGFLLTYAPGDARAAVMEALKEFHVHDVEIDTAGASIIYAD
ncbi:MAG: GHMP kinase [Proteobacteria bacterium]|nr:GHMP kinase [Pseudomonadota bacterium]